MYKDKKNLQRYSNSTSNHKTTILNEYFQTEKPLTQDLTGNELVKDAVRSCFATIFEDFYPLTHYSPVLLIYTPWKQEKT